MSGRLTGRVAYAIAESADSAEAAVVIMPTEAPSGSQRLQHNF